MIRIDTTQLALCAAIVIAALALLSQWRAVARMRSSLQRDLARIFEEVDQLRLDGQREPELDQRRIPTIPAAEMPAPAPAPLAPAAATGVGYAAALELAAQGADQAEIAARCGLSAPEARILVAMRGLQPQPCDRR